MNILILTIIFLGSFNLYAQRFGRNLHDFEHRKFYFGTQLGTTITSYKIVPKTDLSNYNSVFNIDVESGPGIAIHIPVISWAPVYAINIRFMPSISFHETVFNYSYRENKEPKVKFYRHNMTNLNFPILFKLNSKRINNFSAYALTGTSYSLNLQNDVDVDQSLSEPILKISQHDFAYHVGGGFDFYLPYYKFGLELRLTNGINNLLIQDNTFYSSPLESIKSHIWWFSITFEG